MVTWPLPVLLICSQSTKERIDNTTLRKIFLGWALNQMHFVIFGVNHFMPLHCNKIIPVYGYLIELSKLPSWPMFPLERWDRVLHNRDCFQGQLAKKIKAYKGNWKKKNNSTSRLNLALVRNWKLRVPFP